MFEKLHGRVVPDPYRTLEEGDSAECTAWLADQDALFAQHSASWTRRETFRASLDELVAEGGAVVPTVSTPVWRGERRFFLRRAPEQQSAVLMFTDLDDFERSLLDPLALDASGTSSLIGWRPSWSGELLAYQVTHKGDERPVLWVLNVSEHRVIEGPLIPGRKTSVAWLPGDVGFYYVCTPEATGAAGSRVMLHRTGDDPEDDAVVFETEMPTLAVKTSSDGRWLMLSGSSGATSGNVLWLAELGLPNSDALEPRPIHDGTADGTRAVLKFCPQGSIYAVTDAEAPLGRLCVVDPAEPRSELWRTVIGQDSEAVFDNCVIMNHPDTGVTRLLVSRSRHGVGELTIHDADGTKIGDIPTPRPGTISQLTAPPGGGTNAWFSYTDFVTAPAVYRFRLDDGSCMIDSPKRDLNLVTSRKAIVEPIVEQVSYTSYDGTLVRMYLIGLPGHVTEPRPTLLTAYGGFGASSRPGYSPTALAWVRAGGLYAVASVRGGGEEGTGWHAAGSGRNKPNAIADFIAAAQWLIAQGRTSTGQLAIKGGSHSGFLVAAALTQRPDLYAAAVCSGAITDMVRYQHFGLGRLWTEEFGTAADPDQLEILLSYSPYHRAQSSAAYPAVLLTCSRVDPRVDSLHSRKMTAALQHSSTSEHPVLLRCENDIGHGPRSASQWVDLQVDILAFCATHTGFEGT